MAHGTPPGTNAQHGPRLWIAALVGLATLILGFVGHWRYEQAQHPGTPPDLLSALYHGSQLFILHAPHLEGQVPWQLHVARLLGAGLFFAAGAVALARLFRDDLQLLRLHLPWGTGRKGHIVVCGLGDLGLRLALEGRARGLPVVAIEKQGSTPTADLARRRGVLVLDGDACDRAVLRRARVDRAEFVLAGCRADETNVAVAAAVGTVVSGDRTRTKPVLCRLLITEPRTRDLLASESLFSYLGPSYRVNCRDLDWCDTAARQALRRHPLDFLPVREHDATVVHLVVVGFGPVGQSLALHAARSAHFANEVGGGILPRITVVDAPASRAWEEFQGRYPHLDKVCTAARVSHDLNDPSLAAQLIALAFPERNADTLVTFALCSEDDPARNLRVGLELARDAVDLPAQTLFFEPSATGFAALFPHEGRGSGAIPHLHPFGMKEDIFTWEALLHESEDKLARAIHEHFVRIAGPGSEKRGWDDLPDGLRDSNRQAADHIPVKLRALGYHDEPLRNDGDRVEAFTPAETELLAKMEHFRWCAERWLANWRWGPETDRARKINRCLVPWDELRPEDQRKDPDSVTAIPAILAQSGRGIYR